MQQSFGGGARSSTPERTDPKEVEVEAVARSLAEVLEQGLTRNRFERLVLVAPPHFLGLLRGTVGEQVAKGVHQSINKDDTQLPARDLPSHVNVDQGK